MQNQRGGNDQCWDKDCTYQKPHFHIHTPNGSYVKYIIEKPKERKLDNWSEESQD